MASLYFNDPDGNELAFAARVAGRHRRLDFVPTPKEWVALNIDHA
ncbi:hypothetical protein [Paenibacillus sacheonensis]|nr:hypothetical protein [Paenibacillus sacheonensis]MBM7567208.1 hypothetical protein [Paenibacillus sacheonensis]